MLRRPTAAARLARMVIGIITVWCLGCSGYEPLLGSLLGRGSGMSCGSEMAASLSASAAGNAGSATHASAFTAAGTARQAFDCGCGSCHAPSPDGFVIHLGRLAPPTTHVGVVTEPSSVTRTPIAPPPQARA